PQLRENLLDMHVRLAEIGKAYPFQEVTRQREPYAVNLPGDLCRYLYAPVLIQVERLDPGIKCLRIRKRCKKGSPRGDRPAKSPPQAARIVVELAPGGQLLCDVVE